MMHNIESTGNSLIDHICRTIAINEPFSMEEIVTIYNKLTSVDKLLELIVLAKEQNCSLMDVKEKKTEKKLEVLGNIKLGFNVGPQTKK